MSKTYIEREALESKAVYMHGFGKNKYVPLKAIQQAQAADVVAVKHGRWLDGRCTNCWWEAPDFVQYEGYELNDWEPTPCCPNCGAMMNGGDDK